MQNKNILTVEEAAKYLKMSKSSIYRFTSLGILIPRKPFGRRSYFIRSELDAILEGNAHTYQQS